MLQAIQQGAKLVLLPEMMPDGYTLNEAIWGTAEPFDGPSTQWMRALSKRFAIYLGTSFLEADGEHFYNTFVLTGTQGEVVARVRKSPPPPSRRISLPEVLIAAGLIRR